MTEHYSGIDRLLHRLVLSRRSVLELLFDIERQFWPTPIASGSSVLITGLARAGTTQLMRALHGSEQFAALTYADMPFIMAPNSWHRLSGWNQRKRIQRERAHRDGINVDADSPEAFEEIFWRTHHGDDYIALNHLRCHAISNETTKAFEQFQALARHRYGKGRYLSKNNNHLLRLPALIEALPTAQILIPFRRPADQASSLLKQHQRFSESDDFTAAYMNWLVHHEFGQTHRPFRFPAQTIAPGQNDDTQRVDYWLARWLDAYQFIHECVSNAPANVIPVCYERLCTEPSYWQALCRALSLPTQLPSHFRSPSRHIENGFEPDPMNQADWLYRQLDQLGSERLEAAQRQQPLL